MEERKIIQSKLDARQKMVKLSNEELLNLSKDVEKFDEFIFGFANAMDFIFVCYAYQYNDIIRKMINENIDRIDENEELSQSVYKILNNLDAYSKENSDYRREISDQYEAVEAQSLYIDKFKMTLADFDKMAADCFKKMNADEIDSVPTDKNFISVVNYLVKYHPVYLSNCDILSDIKSKLTNVNVDSFDNKKEYKTIKKVASKTLTRLEKKLNLMEKEQVKIKK